jgi:6-pyruvoyltetrahydropterin/6-carboxytetrahydropterin synthase
MSLFEATVQHTFRAAHSLPLPTGQAEEMHEHDWSVTARFQSPTLDDTMAVVIDFVAVDAALKAICGPLDGTSLNDLPDFADGKASAERVAQWLADRLAASLADVLRDEGPWLASLTVTEAPGCQATYYARHVAS